jgi:hypothetical protein
MAATTATRKGTCEVCRREYRAGQAISVTPSGAKHLSCSTISMSLNTSMRTNLRTRPMGHRI